MVGWLLVIALVGALLFYGLGGWHFSNVLRRDLLEVRPAETTYDVEVVAVDGPEVTLRGEDALLDHPGVVGLAWDGGYAQAGDVISASSIGDEETVTRRYLPGPAQLDGGTMVDLDPYAFSGDPLSSFNYPFTEVTYESPVGDMGAWYVRGSTDTWMIVVHGRGASREEGLRLLPFAWDRGYHVLVVDYRNDEGRGADPSSWYRFGATEWEDVAGAARYAREQGASDLVMVGYSMGGAAVVNFLARSPLRNQVSAAILDSPVLDLEAVVDHNAAQTPLGIGPWNVPSTLTAVAKWISSWRYDLDWDAHDYVQTLWRDLHVPMLIFHGTGDSSVPYASSHEMELQRPDLVTLVTVEGAEHTMSWNVDPDAYEAAVAAFLDGAAAG